MGDVYGENGEWVAGPPVEPARESPTPSRYCLMVSQSSAKTCKHKSTWWVSYFVEYGAAAKAACDQHLAAAIRIVKRRDGEGSPSMPNVFAIEGTP